MASPPISMNLDEVSRAALEGGSIHHISNSQERLSFLPGMILSQESGSGANLSNRLVSVIPPGKTTSELYQILLKLAENPFISLSDYAKILETVSFPKALSPVDMNLFEPIGDSNTIPNPLFEDTFWDIDLIGSENNFLNASQAISPPVTSSSSICNSKNNTSETLVVRKRASPDNETSPFPPEKIIFIKALKVTTSLPSDEFKRILSELGYEGSLENSPLHKVYKDICARLQKLTDAEILILEKQDITLLDIQELIAAYHKSCLKQKNYRHIKPISRFGELEIKFVRALTKANSFDALRQALAETSYANAKDTTLSTKKTRILNSLKNFGDSEVEKTILAKIGITKDQVSELVARCNSTRFITTKHPSSKRKYTKRTSTKYIPTKRSSTKFTPLDITFLKALIKTDSFDALKKALKGTKYATGSNNAISVRKTRLLKSLRNRLSEDNKRYLSAQGITQDHIDKLLFKFTPSDVAFIKAIIDQGSRKDYKQLGIALKGTAFRGPTKPNNLRGKKQRILKLLRTLSDYDKKELINQGITQDQINQLTRKK